MTKKQKTWKSEYFYGNKISDYGIKNGYIDYATLAKSFDCVLCNDIANLFFTEINGEYHEPLLVNGSDYDEENEHDVEIFQYFIISEQGKEILGSYTNEIIYYVPIINAYVWGITQWETSWDYALTDIKIENEK